MHETAVNRIVALLLAQQKGVLTIQEQEELDGWINTSEANRQLAERCLDQAQVSVSLEQIEAIEEEAALQRFKVKNGLGQAPVVPFRKRPWRWIAAAVTIGILATGVWLFFPKDSKKRDHEPVATVNKGNNIQPGTNKAILTLSDGSRIILDDTKQGTLANEGGAAVDKNGDVLIYKSDHADKKQTITHHTMSTPRGAFFELTLPDRTRVWLNAESSIRYPTVFTGKERKVEVTGEAYFEVAKKADQPFIVTVNNVQVKVLGTHFNIRGYTEDGATKTTLLEGSVQVSASSNQQSGTLNPEHRTILGPSQQAVILNQSDQPSPIPVQTVDVENVIAWKSGYFDFKATSLADIMKEIKRWYAGVDAIDIKELANDRFTATIPRNVPLSTMLIILEETGRVHFEVRDKTIMVTK